MNTAQLALIGLLGLAPLAQSASDSCSFCASEGHASAASALSDRSIYQLDATWTTDRGGSLKLSELRGRPVIMAMFFTSCGYACPRIVEAMAQIQSVLPAAAQRQAKFVLVSFDDKRDTVTALQAYRAQHGLDPVSWVLLRGAPDDIRELSAMLGVAYKKDTAGLFSHSNVISILNAEGEIVHQRIGLEGGLDEAARAVVAAR